MFIILWAVKKTIAKVLRFAGDTRLLMKTTSEKHKKFIGTCQQKRWNRDIGLMWGKKTA